MTEPVPPGSSTSEEELDPGEESEPEVKDNLEITIDARNREEWPDIIFQARRHMRCHPQHRKRHRDPWITCALRNASSSSDEGDGDKVSLPPEPEPEQPRFHLFVDLPKELRDKIMLMTVDPVIVEGDIRIDFEWRQGPQAHFRQHLIRKWGAISLYAVSRETRALATAFFGPPDPRTFPFSPAQDAVKLIWDGSMLPATWRTTDDYREAGPVVSAARRGNPNREWEMPWGLCERVWHVVVDGRYARFGHGSKGPWQLVFGLVRDFFPETRFLELRMWDLDDEGFDGGYDPTMEALYRVDQMDFFDRLVGMSEDGRVPFPKLRTFRVVPKLAIRTGRKKFRKANKDSFLVVRNDENPTTGS
ncbi:hypothetical protein ColLi_08948 [Colletotrichum liriopes]|uniref:2EXR domain-containing protein n=1 Tax=Colletotrichum liriopes TaxID=708192 RepID=A0AA37LUQ7_9PEZI|nr:hypothetical protein ColLi_08948 [Colletotrichum liriopes]